MFSRRVFVILHNGLFAGAMAATAAILYIGYGWWMPLYFYGVLWFHILAHETGHWLASLLTPAKTVEVQLGVGHSWFFHWRGIKFEIGWLPLGGFTGSYVRLPWDMAVIFAAGPLATILVTIAGFYSGNFLGLAIGVYGIGILMANLDPFTKETDGSFVIKSLKTWRRLRALQVR